ncbi:MAG: radical SAM protein [Candidatus Zixiibacteriota bacterium]
MQISSICVHQGEEPVISGPHGICNVFFSHCNLQCIYCQNHQISDRYNPNSCAMSLQDAVGQIESILDLGIGGVGFVSPSHFVPQMHMIIDQLRRVGRRPVIVYNSNGYDRLQTIRSLEGTIPVYLPDLKYLDATLGQLYSRAPDYPQVATLAIREMFRQTGSELNLNQDGSIRSGLIIRHLVLPGHVENSKAVLRFVAEELSPDVYVSLMSQYYPTPAVADHSQLSRCLYPEEYEEVLDEFDRLGLQRGFVQQLSSADNYRPDFRKSHPFQ